MLGQGNDCLMPLYIKQDSRNLTFKYSMFNRGNSEDSFVSSPYLRVACGRCINCKVRKANEWSLRLEMEAHDWKDACFVTLTYNNEHLPYVAVDFSEFVKTAEERRIYEIYQPFVPTVVPDDISSFVKRLRKSLGTCTRLKFFGVCEYGTRYGRPHAHILIFGLPSGKVTEALVDKAWNYGGMQVGFTRVDPFYGIGTCKYVAGYIMKKLYAYDENDPLLWSFRMRETSRQSLHIGENYFFSHLDELQISEFHPYIDYQGNKAAIPRTFHRKLVKQGLLPKVDVSDMVYLQHQELFALSDFCRSHHSTIDEYFAGRRRLAKAREFQKTAKRRNTGDI